MQQIGVRNVYNVLTEWMNPSSPTVADMRCRSYSILNRFSLPVVCGRHLLSPFCQSQGHVHSSDRFTGRAVTSRVSALTCCAIAVGMRAWESQDAAWCHMPARRQRTQGEVAKKNADHHNRRPQRITAREACWTKESRKRIVIYKNDVESKKIKKIKSSTKKPKQSQKRWFV